MDKLKKIIITELHNIIKNNTKLITEKWSISDDADFYTDKVLDDIFNDLKNSSNEFIDKGINALVGSINNYAILNKTITINYVIYNCLDDYVCDFLYNEAEKQNGFEEKENTLYITLYMVNYKWRKAYCERNLVHEIEHIVQINYGFDNNVNYKNLTDKAYEHASDVLNHENGYNKADKLIAKLFYYSNSHEQDAFMQEYAKDIKRNITILRTKKSETHNILSLYSNICDYFLNHKNDSSIKNAIQQYRIFGYNMNNFELMATKQLNRFKRKMNNIEKNFKTN